MLAVCSPTSVLNVSSSDVMTVCVARARRPVFLNEQRRVGLCPPRHANFNTLLLRLSNTRTKLLIATFVAVEKTWCRAFVKGGRASREVYKWRGKFINGAAAFGMLLERQHVCADSLIAGGRRSRAIRSSTRRQTPCLEMLIDFLLPITCVRWRGSRRAV